MPNLPLPAETIALTIVILIELDIISDVRLDRLADPRKDELSPFPKPAAIATTPVLFTYGRAVVLSFRPVAAPDPKPHPRAVALSARVFELTPLVSEETLRDPTRLLVNLHEFHKSASSLPRMTGIPPYPNPRFWATKLIPVGLAAVVALVDRFNPAVAPLPSPSPK